MATVLVPVNKTFLPVTAQLYIIYILNYCIWLLPYSPTNVSIHDVEEIVNFNSVTDDDMPEDVTKSEVRAQANKFGIVG